MSTPPSTVPFRVPEANLGTTTSWLPLVTMHRSEKGCGTTLLYYSDVTYPAAWDPHMGLVADKSFRGCLPRIQTSWWLEYLIGLDRNTVMSISFAAAVAKPTGGGSGACGHQAYSVAASSVKGDGSTFLACCPSGYTFMKVGDAQIQGGHEQCTSSISSGQVIQYLTSGSGAYTATSETVTSATVAFGIQINGWMFDSGAAAAGQCRATPPGNGTTAEISPTVAKVLLGLNVGTLALGLAIALAGFLLFRKARREKAVAVGGGAGSQGAYADQVQQAQDLTKASSASPPAWEVNAYGYVLRPPQELAGASLAQELAAYSLPQEQAAVSPSRPPLSPK